MQVHRARKQIDPAVKLIREIAARPDATPQLLVTLADLAEKMQQFPLAKELYDQLASPKGPAHGKLSLAAFLGRRGETKDALEICKPPWTNDREVAQIAGTCINILFGSDNNRTPDPDLINRVEGWFE